LKGGHEHEKTTATTATDSDSILVETYPWAGIRQKAFIYPSVK